MENVMMMFFMILMVFFTYGYSSFYFYKHRTDPKTIFIPKSEEEEDSFVVGGQTDGQTNSQTDDENSINPSSTCDPDATYKENGDNSMFCLNGGKCLQSGSGTKSGTKSGTNIYNCSCVEPYIGDNCWSKGDENVGVKIDIMDNFTSPTEITRVAMFDSSGKNSFIQYNDYL